MPEGFRMNEAREGLEAHDEAWTVTVHEIAVGRVEAPALDGRQTLETLPPLAGCRSAFRAVAREDDDLGRSPHRGLQTHPWIPLTLIGGHRRSSGKRDQLRDKGALAGHDEGLGPENIEHARERAAQQQTDAYRDLSSSLALDTTDTVSH